MPTSYLHFGLQSGYIHNWLAAGPMAVPVINPEELRGHELVQHILRAHTAPDSGITGKPVERGSLEEGTFKVGNYQGAWSYYACKEDHYVDQSAYYPAPHYLRSWAYAQLVSKVPRRVALVLTAFNKADVWLNGKLMHSQEEPGTQPGRGDYQVDLRPGGNEVLVRFESVALGNCPHAIALQVCNPDDGKKPAAFISNGEVRVRLPTTIHSVKRRNFLERFFDAAYIDRDIFGPQDQIFVRWPEDWKEPDDVTLRLMGPKGWIFGEATVYAKEGEKVFLGYGSGPPAGDSRILIMPKPVEFYQDNTRVQRELTVWTAGLAMYTEVPSGTYPERCNEALVQAARQNLGLFSEIAKMELGRLKTVDPAVLTSAIEVVRERQQGCDLQLLGLLGMIGHYGEHADFPVDLKAQIEAAASEFAYHSLGLETDIESQSLLQAACASLAGWLFPQGHFNAENRDGNQLREQGEELAREWLRLRLAYGFGDWHGQASMEEIFVALAHLVDFTQDEQVWELASLLLDKMIFSLAVNSYKGVYAPAHHQAGSPGLRSALFDSLSGICRMLFGRGAYNPHIAGAVSMATMREYELPAILVEIANDQPVEMLHHERQALPGKPEANLVAYKTPDYLLASAQDYRPGELGRAEHLWQATFGLAAIVYVSHPGNAGEADAFVPNFWLGNRFLPRIAQWKDVLIALHQLPDDDWMGFTHAYFPAYAFDEYVLRGGWAFARKGEGYLALTASSGLSLVKSGKGAYQELRAAPSSAAWVCHMGRLAQDGDFAAFQEKILALPVVFEGLSVRLSTLRGEALSFGWQEPLRVNGEQQPLSGFKHVDDPYCQAELPCNQVEIRLQDDLLRLDLTGLS